ncbi:MAG TPA: amidase [Xanthobacteraceae bacterium]|nr:amidase [Xanthobacteraceae bacterium]
MGAGPGAVTLAEEHRAGRRDPRATVRSALARARRLEPDLNAFAVLDENAVVAADDIARRIARGDDPGPLAGVPVSVKDILDVAGLPTRWGSPLMAQAPPAKTDVVAVARLRKAGAVIIGKTTTTEFAHSPLGISPLTGLTRNPWAPHVTCGGSSAGAGVAVATGVTPLALATDAGCSARLPAACCGVYGFKPTLGCIPHDRVPEAFANFIHLGLLAGCVRDLAYALDALAGPHWADPQSLCRPRLESSATLPASPLAGARVIVWMTTGNARVAEEIVITTRAAAAMIERLGARVIEEPYPLAHPDPIWRVLQQSNWAVRFAGATPQERSRLSATLNAGIEAGLSYRGLDLQRALVRRSEIFRGVQAAFNERADFILTPCVSAPPVAAEHDLDAPLEVDGVPVGDLRAEWTPYLSLFDLSGHPALVVPAGFAGSGAPLGIQLVAPWGEDARLLTAAAVYEAAVATQHRPLALSA